MQVGAAPRQQRPDAHQQHQCQHQRAVDLVIVGAGYRDFLLGEQLRQQRVHRPPQGSESDAQQQQVVQQERRLARQHCVQPPRAPHQVVAPEKYRQRNRYAYRQEQQEYPAQRRCAERVHRRHRPAPIHKHSVQRQPESDINQHNVPHSEHPAPLLHHYGVDESGQRDPGHKGGVLHRIPEPETAPAQYRVGPPGTQQQPGRQQRPDAHAPGASGVNPFVAALAANQPAQRERHRDADAGQPGHQRRRMQEHSEVSQQRVDALSVRYGKGQPLERVRHKRHHRQKEHLNKHQDGDRPGQRRAGCRRRQSDGQRRHCRQRKGDVQQRTFVAGVERNPGVDVGHCQVAVRRDIGQRKVARDERLHQRQRGYQQNQRQGVGRLASAVGQCRRAPQLPGHGCQAGIDGQRQPHPKASGSQISHY